MKIIKDVAKMNDYQRKQACYKAMQTAYQSLKIKNLPQSWKVGIGVRIYKFHYPHCAEEVALENASSLFTNEHNLKKNVIH